MKISAFSSCFGFKPNMKMQLRSFTLFQKIQKLLSTWSSFGKNYSNFVYPKLIIHNRSHDNTYFPLNFVPFKLWCQNNGVKIYWPAPKGNPKLFHTLMGSYSTKTSPSFYKWGLCVCNSQSHTWQHHLHTNLMLKLNFGYLEFVSVWYFHFYICYIMNSKIEYIGTYVLVFYKNDKYQMKYDNFA